MAIGLPYAKPATALYSGKIVHMIKSSIEDRGKLEATYGELMADFKWNRDIATTTIAVCALARSK